MNRDAEIVFDTVSEGLFLCRVVDGELVLASNNKAFAEILGPIQNGCVASSTAPWSSVELVDERRRRIEDAHPPPLMAALRGERADPMVVGMVPTDGEPVWLRISAQPVIDAEGTVSGVAGTIVDVSQEWTAAQRDQAAHLRFEQLVERIADLKAILAADGSISYVSPTHSARYGLHAGDPSSAWISIIHPDDLATAMRLFGEQTDRHGHAVNVELRLRTVNGTWRHFQAVGANRLDEPGVSGIVVTGRDVTGRVQADERMAFHSLHDALTGLPNRSLLRDRIEQAVARAHRAGVLCLNLDGFQQINDSLGHASGDRVLLMTAERLRAAVRPVDTVARLGGDDFVILREDVAGTEEALELARDLHGAVVKPMDVGGETVVVGCGIGIAISGSEHATDLLQDADTALHRAKQAGPNQLWVFDGQMARALRRRLSTEQAVRESLNERRLRAYHQPIVDLATGAWVGTEALLRLIDRDGRIVSPGEFIEVAEDSGLIVDLGAAVLDQACNTQTRWDLDLGQAAPDYVAVNLSARQLASPDIVGRITAALKQSGLPPERLVLELTETALVDVTRSRPLVERLHDAGIRLALDDFGTGWASLTYLRQFPIDIVKIDIEFVAGLGRDPKDTEVVRAIVGLAHALDMTVVAEGVEREDQATLLREFGCDRAQGYLYGRPLAPEELYPSR